MTKKAFTTAPKPKPPTDDQIAAFEKGGTGTDQTSKAKSAERSAASQEPLKRLSIDLPRSLHTRFKTACSATDNKMAAEIAAFIERRTAELEAAAGISKK